MQGKGTPRYNENWNNQFFHQANEQYHAFVYKHRLRTMCVYKKGFECGAANQISGPELSILKHLTLITISPPLVSVSIVSSGPPWSIFQAVIMGVFYMSLYCSPAWSLPFFSHWPGAPFTTCLSCNTSPFNCWVTERQYWPLHYDTGVVTGPPPTTSPLSGHWDSHCPGQGRSITLNLSARRRRTPSSPYSGVVNLGRLLTSGIDQESSTSLKARVISQ